MECIVLTQSKVENEKAKLEKKLKVSMQPKAKILGGFPYYQKKDCLKLRSFFDIFSDIFLIKASKQQDSL